MSQNSYKIAVIPGDGIGKETTPEGVRVLQAAQKRFDLGFDFEDHDFSSADYYVKTGEMLPPDWKDRLSGSDAIFFGAVGWPEIVPDHVSACVPPAQCRAFHCHWPVASPATST